MPRIGEIAHMLLTGWICLENFYSKFNRAFRVDAHGFCVVPRQPRGGIDGCRA